MSLLTLAFTAYCALAGLIVMAMCRAASRADAASEAQAARLTPSHETGPSCAATGSRPAGAAPDQDGVFAFDLFFTLPCGDVDPDRILDDLFAAFGGSGVVIGLIAKDRVCVSIARPGEACVPAILEALDVLLGVLPDGTRLREIRSDLPDRTALAARFGALAEKGVGARDV